MPYSRKPAYKRKYLKRVPLSKKVSQISKKVSYLKKSIPHVLHDTIFGLPTVVTTAGSITCLTDVTQGDDVNNVQGRNAMLKKITLKGTISGFNAADYNYLRVMVVRKKGDADNTLPVLADIIDSSVAANILAGPSRAALSEYTWYYDKLFVVADNAGPAARTFKKTIRINKPLTFAASGEFDKGHLFLVLVSTDAANGPSAQIYCRAYMN